MVKGKQKATVWLTPAVKEQIEAAYRSDNCRSQSEFIEQAVEFYLGYLHTKNAGQYLPEALATMLMGMLDGYAKRIGGALHKMAVEQNLCNHLIAEDTDMDRRTYELLRGRSVREVNSTNGCLSLKDALDFQKSV